ncbi:unnamed protein product [Didymodactylos carnosus]|uniref:Uncharacterized protein n=1 Tax=Didymodactylos carnosus TaxID=1234261 RepID=A0A814RED8_9BILA|nr:unnamed protein product [Didymodactylos carnosus]CAF1132059.1 unnamed protein product [Didymodactylos carnosus]CAF3868152.1 unnamed protein product [Didymodactylos carnosus]CAF3895851.1 unnamed protein product [Didymodactylos carnosus]
MMGSQTIKLDYPDELIETGPKLDHGLVRSDLYPKDRQKSWSAVYSTIVNFTVNDFLKRGQKLSILNKIKCFKMASDNEKSFIIPIHHKHLKDNRNLNKNSNHNNIDNVTTDDIEKIILSAYETAKVLIDNLEMCK